jgi:acetolactate synthase-1/2/3 large subunit
LIDVDVPWIPRFVKPKDDATIIQLDLDPIVQHIPWWGFKVDLPIRGDSARTLPRLTGIAKRMVDSGLVDKQLLAQRLLNVRKDHEVALKSSMDEAYAHRKDKPIDPRWLSYCINQVKTDNAIIFSETVTSPFVDYVEFTEPGTIFRGTPFGSLGWSFGAGLGAKLAQPNRDVFALCGDGSYIYCVPTACHYVAAAYALPILTVVYNNQAWYASKRPVETLFPNGKAKATGLFSGVYLEPSPPFDLIAKSFGAYAEMIEDPEEVQPTLQRALETTRKQHIQALLNVILKKP